MRYFVEVHATGVASERHDIFEDEASFGTSPEATLRVRGSIQLVIPLLIFAVHPEGMTVQIPERIPGTITFRGEATRAVVVPWGEDIYVGGVRLAFVAENGSRKGPSSIVVLAATVALLASGAALLRWAVPASSTAREAEPPALAASAAQCGELNRDGANGRATQLLAEARAKEQRAPFDRTDGVEALGLLGEAKACFDTAGMTTEALATEQERASWQQRMDDEYASLRLRLRVALDQKQSGDALAALRGLEALLAAQPRSPYRAWLSGIRRDLERRSGPGGS
jgi:hypothetical protein